MGAHLSGVHESLMQDGGSGWRAARARWCVDAPRRAGRLPHLFLLLAAMASNMAFAATAATAATATDAVHYAISINDAGHQQAQVEASFPVAGADTVLYLPTWTPGYYVREDYKANVVDLQARDGNGRVLAVRDPGGNRWQVDTSGATRLVVRYVLSATGRSVSLNEVTAHYAVFNGSATYIAAKGTESLPQHVSLSLPDGWTSASGMVAAGDAGHDYTATDYAELLDSPILAGELDVVEFESAGTPHVFAYNRGAAKVDTARIAADLKAMTDETRAFWAERPWPKYVFLVAFREAPGGLEHKFSTFVNIDPARFATPAGYRAFVALLAHEYQHAFNVKRLRPRELGPFDYESTPAVPTLWISEGLTSYYSNLMLRRSGLVDTDAYLAGLSRQITALQNAPGRLRQSLEQSSLEVWSNSLSGIGASDQTVSYYTKGEVAGFLLDAHIRRATDGRASLDDVMKQAYEKYSGDTGFAPGDFAAIAEGVAGHAMQDWFSAVVGSPGEVDYAEALDWYGLVLDRKVSTDGGESWSLVVAPDASAAQDARLREWLD